MVWDAPAGTVRTSLCAEDIIRMSARQNRPQDRQGARTISTNNRLTEAPEYPGPFLL